MLWKFNQLSTPLIIIDEIYDTPFWGFKEHQEQIAAKLIDDPGQENDAAVHDNHSELKCPPAPGV